jgi:hypothetical protein
MTYKYEYFVIICRAIFLKIKNNNLNFLKHSKFLYLIRFSYEEFNEYNKLKFKNNLVYLFSFDKEDH